MPEGGEEQVALLDGEDHDEEHGDYVEYEDPWEEHYTEKEKYQALAAHSKLRGTSVSMILCIVLFLCILTARLEMAGILSWPVYVDFIPLWILPCLLYLTAADFAATRISTEAALGKVVVVGAGFLLAVDLLFFTVFICMKVTHVVQWPWTVVLAPFWATLIVSQFFLCFLIPGFLRVDKLKTFFGIFAMVWLMGLVFLLIGMKLDSELPHATWCGILSPAWVMLALQCVVFFDSSAIVDLACRVTLLVCAVLLGIQLDGYIRMPWLLISGPIIFILFLNLVMVVMGKDEDFEAGT